jgi:hypothetical protein
MKLKFTQVITVCSFALALLALPYVSSADTGKKEDPKENKEVKKTTKVSASRNNSSVRIYPDIIKRVMHVVAKETEATEIDFFVFTQEGTLVQHYKMKSGDHEKIKDLQRGIYVFHVFEGDEETASGKIDIR